MSLSRNMADLLDASLGLRLSYEALKTKMEGLQKEVHSWRVRACASENVIARGATPEQLEAYRRWVASNKFPNEMPE